MYVCTADQLMCVSFNVDIGRRNWLWLPHELTKNSFNLSPSSPQSIEVFKVSEATSERLGSSPQSDYQTNKRIICHRCRNRCGGQSGHGLTTFLTCYYKAKSGVRRVISLSHLLLVDASARTIAIGTPWSVYCRASSEMSDAAVAVHPNCSSTQHSKVTHSLHKHLAWPLQFCFLRRCIILLYCPILSLRCSTIQWHSSTTCTRQQDTYVVVTVWLCIHTHTSCHVVLP